MRKINGVQESEVEMSSTNAGGGSIGVAAVVAIIISFDSVAWKQNHRVSVQQPINVTTALRCTP